MAIKSTAAFTRNIRLALGLFVMLVISFVLYVHAEKQIDQSNNLRHQSLLLANELRASSDDLTRMVRGYVATGNPVYKRYFQEILDIRDGRIPRPPNYESTYWDLLLVNDALPSNDREQAVALLDTMRASHFTREELAKLMEAKARSDALSKVEFAAMALVEATTGDRDAQRQHAMSMVFGDDYNRAKAEIMRPIHEFYRLMSARTLTDVRSAEQRAMFMRLVLIAFALSLAFTLWRINQNLQSTLGGSMSELYQQITRIGSDDLSSIIQVTESQKNSILGWLAETQRKLLKLRTERLQAELALRESARHTQAILDNMLDGVLTVNAQGVIESYNNAAADIFGYSAEEVVGRNLTMLLPNPTKSLQDTYLERYLLSIEKQMLGTQREAEGQHKNGRRFPISLSVSTLVRSDKTMFIAIVRDITQQRQHEEEIYRLAFYDPLTRLPNRRLLFDRLKQAMANAHRTGQHGALMFLDLDHFKQLNDSLGHDVGDLLLQQVAMRLLAGVREGDSVARMGGDEFVMLIEALSSEPEEAATQAESIAYKILQQLGKPYQLREHHYLITPSIGIVLFINQLETMEDLLKKADVAMYQAKAAGRNNARFFDPTMQAAVSVRTELEKSLKQALAQQEFVLHYQLQVDAQQNPIGLEALVRWQKPGEGMVSPASFIPLAEETGLILPLGQWVLETACQQLVALAKHPQSAHWSLAVNVSALQFAQPDFVATVSLALQKTGANPHRLKLELTESMLLGDVDAVIVKMAELKTLGVSFALDDFGTGYSSLAYLKRLPLNQLKIDQSFVRDLLRDPNDAAIAKTIIELGHSLGLTVMAEGVETAEQQRILALMGCDSYQGYYFARPVPLAQLPEAIAGIPANPAALTQ